MSSSLILRSAASPFAFTSKAPLQWGPVYTFFDTAIDLYVTIMIAYFLARHIHQLRAAQTQGNIPSYVGIVVQNILRTLILTVVNLASAVFILRGNSPYGIMVIWPIVNTLFVLLIGYDVDLAQAMRRLHFTVYAHRLPPPQTPAMTYPQGGNNHNVDPFTAISSQCPYCGRRRSDELATPAALDDERHRFFLRQRAISITPSFLAATTLSSSNSNAECGSREASYSPSYLSAFQASCYEDSTVDLSSPHSLQSSNQTFTHPLCDKCFSA
ncbi:hypothetical protein BDB00DRAFT_854182 [Zychaea mexicana]|uniref:uncharacterized protein n=1 Tax=Zychaea mexicana TaxID=64656 RepID=UPI0022FEA8FD|nr:uncharacterized protein BDB00DRAFT_854182 [Zychaea mexicana]KAI9484639.1 hypothetical protein BDB00DRAFT_854182 [Zychaea mexicana]